MSAGSITRESYFWHKLHSLTGVIPIGFYMLQHLTLNSFSLAGPDKFNGVIGFFQSVPPHVLIPIEFLVLILPILFHGVYGLFITSRAQFNYAGQFRVTENRMFVMQRISGVVLFVLIIMHVASTSVNAKVNGEAVIEYEAWQRLLTSAYYVPLALYAIGILLAAYHLAYGIWNFCIRWGITVSPKSQLALQKFSMAAFVAITLLGWAALAGFLMHPDSRKNAGSDASGKPVEISAPLSS